MQNHNRRVGSLAGAAMGEGALRDLGVEVKVRVISVGSVPTHVHPLPCLESSMGKTLEWRYHRPG